MIRNVTSAPIDRFETTHKSDKVEIREKSTQGSHVESRKETGDWVTLGAEESQALTYTKPLAAVHEITIKYLLLQQLVTTLTIDQGAAGAISGNDGSKSTNDLMVQLFEKLGLSTSIDIGDGKTADLQSMTVEDAQNLIADNGYWGVEQTSSRIVDFAVGQIGNDPSKLDKIREAIMNGFNSAKEAFGGQLPDISQKTIDAVMSKLDNLAMPASS
ncbi:MAG: hypothetical protein Q7U85_06285 [Rhodocyclaceae bacterium]|nr:hypothetical protein [Rhodocyclaceae bacterium]